MKRIFNDTQALSTGQYWKIFGRLISSADTGAVLGCLGWILFWLDHIPGHIIHAHPVTALVFLAAFSAGLMGAVIMVQTRNQLGTKTDRFFHILKVCYAIFASLTGILAYFIFPPH